MRKSIVLLFLFFFVTLPFYAQSMSDDDVVSYVSQQQQMGKNNQQIIQDLVKKGVTIQQINRIRSTYDKRKQNTSLGNTVNVEDEQRTRTAPDKVKKENTMLVETQKEKEQVLTRKERQQQLTEGMGFLMPADSIQLLQQLLMEWEEKNTIPIFGHNVFQDKTLNFEPSTNIATPQNYRLGPGDEVIVDIWGASQATIKQTISPDGEINVENLGPVSLAGKTVKEADAYLKAACGSIYANSQVKLSLGQNRTIQVSVMGEVVNPGSYTLSSFSTMFTALYAAGGVNEVGTLRHIQLKRGGRVVSTFDMYDYMLNGKMQNDMRLEDGDVVMVDTYDCLVCISGAVKRPMYYEMKPSETVSTLMDYAGGFTRDAYRGDVRLVRMGQRQREIYTLNSGEQKSFKVMDGDSLSVDAIGITYENLVEIKGAVFRPGQFQMGGDINTVKDLISAGGGVTENAFVNRAVLSRMRDDLTLENQSVDVKGILAGTSPDIPLRKNDVLYVPANTDMQEPYYMYIYGEVAIPGTYRYAANTTVEDFIVLAGGLNDKASTMRVDVARRQRNSKAVTTSDTLAQEFSFVLKDGLVVEGGSDFTLEPFDAVYVRRSPGYNEQQNVRVEGKVLFAGTYVLDRKNQRLSDVIKRAGGLTGEAYAKGARLERKMTPEEKLRAQSLMDMIQRQQDSIDIRSIDIGNTYDVGIELNKAIENPGGDADIVLRDGDRIIIPQLLNTVKVQGAVMYPNTVSFKSGKRLGYYIDQAGGYATRAKSSKAFIVYMNGTVARAKRYSRDVVQPGCEIVVPNKTDRKGMSTAEIFSLSSTSASLATVILTLINLIRNW